MVVLHVVLAAASLVAPDPRQEIVGGEPTEPGEFENVVAVYNSAYICTGSLVAPGVVLTAAHCVHGELLQHVSVAAGQRVSRSNSVPALAIGVHPDFCTECETTDDDIFDYGFVVIDERALAIDTFAIPIVDQDDWDAAIRRGAAVTVVGYGADESDVTEIKRKVVTTITSQTSSGQEFRAGGNFRDSCNGDSGGPAFVQTADGRWLQAGIVSRGAKPCGRGGVYATPYPALAWLQEQTGTQLCGAECGECDCLDTTPLPESDGCGCTSATSDGFAWASLLLLLCVARPRARRRTSQVVRFT